jgi:tetratricopeptide (TPR) repeat protein
LRRPPLFFAVLALAACRTSGRPPSDPASDGRKPDAEAQKVELDPATREGSEVQGTCQPSGAACFDRAQRASEKEPTRAEQQLEACLGCDDAPPASYRLLATLREDRNAKVEAREALMLGVRRHPSSAVLWLGLGRLELALGHSKAGIEAMASAHRLMPSDENVEREYNDALSRYGTDEDRVAAEVDRLVLEAAGRAELNDYKGALKTLQSALQKTAKVPHLAALVEQKIALVQLRHGDRRSAIDALEKSLALEKSPSELRADALISYSEALLGTKRVEDAIRAAEEAITIEPKNPLAHANLGIAKAMKNDRDGAMTALGTAFAFGLARRLTLTEFMTIGPPIDKLKNHPDFAPMVRRAWPHATYPGDTSPKKK